MDLKLIEKIKKLLALSESSNENEAKSAMLKAQKLLIKHKLSMIEVKNYKLNKSDVKEKITNITFTKAKWKGELADIIADNFGCYCYYKTRGTNIVTFLGRDEDITVCNIVYEYAIDCIKSSVKRLKYNYVKNRKSTKGLENDFAMGFLIGLSANFEDQKEKNQEWGLVLVKDKEVMDAYENINFKNSLNVNSSFQGHNEAYLAGEKEGNQFSVSDKIAEGESEEQLALVENN